MNSNEQSDRNLEIAEATWHTIRPHLERDAVIIVSSSLDLREAAETIASDDTKAVSAWIEQGVVSKPSRSQLEEWNSDPTREFSCAIVQPFVLMQVTN
ncbi:MAG: DUF2288 family protein [Bdellovibrionales bacterium]|nr:DUF2288 family protein [Bdellovibrionales bacterium]